MIADAPYSCREQALSARAGALAGVAGAMGMVAFLIGLGPSSGLPAARLLAHIGAALLPAAGAAEGGLAVVVGAALHGLVGAGLGLLYAVCQQRVSPAGLIGVGLFYGFLIWLGGSLLGGWALGDPLRTALRSRSWLLACLLYGLCLALAAGRSVKRSPAESAPAEPLD